MLLSSATDELNEYLGALWCSAGLQLALLFSQMSNQACDSCNQLLEVGEPGSGGSQAVRWELLASCQALVERSVSVV